MMIKDLRRFRVISGLVRILIKKALIIFQDCFSKIWLINTIVLNWFKKQEKDLKKLKLAWFSGKLKNWKINKNFLKK